MSDPQAEPAAPVVKVYAIVVRVVENILLKSRSVGPRTPVQTACRVEISIEIYAVFSFITKSTYPLCLQTYPSTYQRHVGQIEEDLFGQPNPLGLRVHLGGGLTSRISFFGLHCR